jgi:hypothetical protein
MANVKISNLTAATTPLAGTEVLPIVQSGATVKASIANVQTAVYPGGTANGVAYLNGSKVLTTGSALVFDGTNLGVGVTPSAWGSGITAIQLAKDTSVSSHTTGGNIFVNSNTYYNGSNWIYSATRGASQYQQNNGAHIWYQAGSGTAGNAITFTQAMTLDGSGNLGIGVTSPTSRLHVSNSSASTNAIAQFTNGTTGTGAGNGLYVGMDTSNEATIFNFYNSAIKFATNATERARIDSSGNLLVGTISVIGSGKTNVSFNGASAQGMNLQTTYADVGSGFLGFYNSAGSNIGSVTQTVGSAVLYNTTSDQRLKENIQDADSSSSLIDSIQVRQYDWKSDGSHQRYGFVAQELVTVAPEAVYQPTDSEQMMAVDYSKLVPMLVKEIQSLRKRLAALESA